MGRASDLVESAVEYLESGQDVILGAHSNSTGAIIWTERIDHYKVITGKSLQSATLLADISNNFFTRGDIVEPRGFISDPSVSLSRYRVCFPEIRVQIEVNLLFCVLHNLAFK